MIPMPCDAANSPQQQQQQQVIILNRMGNDPSMSSIPSFPSVPPFPSLQALQSQLLLSSIQQSIQQQSSQLFPEPYPPLRAQQRVLQPMPPSQPTVFNVSNLNHSMISPQPQPFGISQPNLIFITLPPNLDMNPIVTPVRSLNMNGCPVHDSKMSGNRLLHPISCTNNNAARIHSNVSPPNWPLAAPKLECDIPPAIGPIRPKKEDHGSKRIKISATNNVPQPKYGMLKPPAKNDAAAYECELCHKKFKYQSNLISHRRVHRVDCPKCSYCGKKFARKSNLLQHIRIHTNERPYKCSYCPKAFKQKHSLTDHIRSHTGERPFSCDVCLKSFAVKHNLIVHKRIHSGEKPYACHICNTNYSSKSGINSHLKHRHRELWAARQANKKKIKTEQK